MMTSADAKAFARVQHAGQLDETGAPYIEHLERVVRGAERRARAAQAQGLPVDPDLIVQAAWLHDVLRDTPTTAADLVEAGFAGPVVEAVRLLGVGPERDQAAASLAESRNLEALLVALSESEHDEAGPDSPAGDSLRRAAAALGYRHG
ncbi:HD domain-containing protein [Methylobacterium sp. JK268]